VVTLLCSILEINRKPQGPCIIIEIKHQVHYAFVTIRFASMFSECVGCVLADMFVHVPGLLLKSCK
jgi:hypothetical protein